MARPTHQAELETLAAAMQTKYGPLYIDPDFFESLIETHPDWYVRRYRGHRWEVRTGVNDKTYFGKTLNEAFSRALMDIV